MRARFSKAVIDNITKARILGLRAGKTKHRFIGIWSVIVEGRVFVRSWSIRPDGWYRTLLREATGTINVEGREIPVRSVRIRSDRVKDAVSRAYKVKYNTPGSIRYVRDLARLPSRETTTELVPGSGKNKRSRRGG